jgi:3-oxoadipate enol-lactonase
MRGDTVPIVDLGEDVALYYEYRGQAGSPLLLLSGFGTSLVEWPLPFLANLEGSHRLILMDNRGMGESVGPMDNYSMAAAATDVAGLLDALGLERVHVFGHSMGGMVGQHFALHFPQRLHSLTLASTAPGGPANPNLVPPQPAVLAQFSQPPSGDRAQDVRDGWFIGYTPAFIERERPLLEAMLETKLAYPEPPPVARQGQMFALTQTHDIYDRLSEISCPTLILTGAEDILVPPQNSHIMAARIPNARLIEYPNAAHGLLVETDGAVERDLLAFLDEVDRGSPV